MPKLKPSQFQILQSTWPLNLEEGMGFTKADACAAFAEESMSSFVGRWEVSLRGMDVNCLQSQSLVTMSAKHYT